MRWLTIQVLLALLTASGIAGAQPETSAVEPNAAQVGQALQYGYRFQQMAPRQNQPQGGLPIPYDYFYSCQYGQYYPGLLCNPSAGRPCPLGRAACVQHPYPGAVIYPLRPRYFGQPMRKRR